MINHKLLLRKMRLEFEVMGEEEDWSQAYLSRRRQRVSIGKVNSPWVMPRCGVPQGSILGPLSLVPRLFLVEERAWQHWGVRAVYFRYVMVHVIYSDRALFLKIVM